jgi:arylsulfatase A-like enzyme
MVNRRQVLFGMAAAVGCMAIGIPGYAAEAGGVGSSPAGRRKPNLVFILVDQWRASATGYEGDTNAMTPNLDRLAGQSLRFRNTVSVCPVCTPYRAALLTGKFPTTTGMFLNDIAFPVEETGMGETLKAAGYATGYIGKWHLDGHGRRAYIPPERRHGWEYWKGAECDHDYNNSHYYLENPPEKKYWEGYDAFAQTKDAQQYIKDHARGEKPFALVVSYGPPHFPLYTAPEEYKKLYEQRPIKVRPNVPEEDRAAAEKALRGYYAQIAAMDKCIGDLLASVDENGLAENTIVIFTSDHGDVMGAHGCRPLMKQVPWDEAARVPFLLRYPPVTGKQGRVTPLPLNTPDILPTLCSLMGIAAPKTVEGDDLAEVVRGTGGPADRAALYMGIAPFGNEPQLKPYRAIRTKQYTYVRDLNGPWLLFDDVKDPYQMDNLVGKGEHAATQKELDMQLAAAMKRNGDPFHSAEESIAEWGYEVRPHGSIPYRPDSKPQSPRRLPATRTTTAS